MQPRNISEGDAEHSNTRTHKSSCWQGRIENTERNTSRGPLVGATIQGGQLNKGHVGAAHQNQAPNAQRTSDVAGSASVNDSAWRPGESEMRADVHLVVQTMRSGSAQTSVTLLAGLRMGLSVGDLARSIRAEAAVSADTHS
jgi:hypothetical protein